MKQLYIYETTNLINGKKYIGQHQGELDDNYLGSGTLLRRAIEKYGAENFKKCILYVASSKEELDQKEKEFIATVDATHSDMYYNIHEGGSGGNTLAGWTDEQREAHRKKLSELFSGENNPRYGVKLSEETKEKIRQNRDTSYMQTPEYRAAMSKATTGELNGMYGKHHTEESKKLMSEHHKGLAAGEKNPMYGKHHTEEAKQKMSQAASERTGTKNSNHKSVNLYADKDRTILKYHFETIQEALLFFGISPTNYSGVNRSIKDNRPYKEYYWEVIKSNSK